MQTKELGDYILIKQLGKGTLGSVFLAEHKFMKKQVAIKIFPEELAMDRSFIQRFEEDIAKLSSLQHPNIVSVHNVCYHDGIYFLVMDCIVDENGESTNLAHYLRNSGGKINETELMHNLTQIASALDYAHTVGGQGGQSKGLLHRGIKLNNILVGNDGWYLSDYGLSRIIGCGAVLTRAYKTVADTLASTSLWAHAANEESRYPFPPLDLAQIQPLQQSFIQTFAFLAPEQKCIDGTSSISYKADIYAFGVLTYYLLTGNFPEGAFPLPSDVRQNLQYDWDRIILSCLRLNPEERPNKIEPLLSQNSSEYSIEEQSFLNMRMEAPQFTRAQAHVHAHAGSSSPTYDNPLQNLEPPKENYDPLAPRLGDMHVKHYQPERKELKAIQPLQTEMAIIPSGDYTRGSVEGSRDEMPPHQIHLDSFGLDIHPVTNEQFVRFLEFVGGEKDSFHRDIIRLRDSRIKRSGGKLSIESGYAKHPVVGVTWYGAISYAKWVGKRLPTEAEWEIAAAGGEDRKFYPTGDDIEKSEANFFSSDTTAVMSYAPTSWNLYDMAGNIYEWCHDWYGYNYYEISQQEPDNPKGPLQGNYRVLKGGCWKSLKEDLRCAKRHRNNPGTVNSTYGFRCASDLNT